MEKYHIELTFTEPLLGTAPLNKELYDTYIATKAPEGIDSTGEVDSIEEMTEKGTTGFHRLDDGSPILYDYMVKGFLKDACGMLARTPESGSSKIRAYKKIIDGLVFVTPRQIPIILNGFEIGILERPLRAQTAQGERIALARSEMIREGASIAFDLLVLGQVTESLLREWLEYGALRGLGQWRNASYGRFTYELSKA
jgi:hypothetical protein